MNNGLFLQKIKVMTYPISSYEFYLMGNRAVSKREGTEIKDRIFSDVREGFYTTKLDSFNMILEKHWYEKVDHFKEFCISNFDREKYFYRICTDLTEKYFYLKDGMIYVDGNKSEGASPIIGHVEQFDEILEVGENHNNKFQWLYLKHMIDTDLLVASFMAENRLTCLNSYHLWKNPIQTTNAILDKMLDGGISETHLHLRAGKSFMTIWNDIMNDRAKIINRKNPVDNIKIDTHEGAISFASYIKITKIIRVILAKYLAQNNLSSIKSFIDEIDGDRGENGDEDFRRSFKELCYMYMRGERFHLLNDINYRKYFDTLKEKFNLSYDVLHRNGEDLINRDIITHVFDEFYCFDENGTYILNMDFNIAPEQILLTKAMIRIKEIGDEDPWFKILFWQYINIKNQIYKYFVQQVTSGKGLDMFSNYYGRQKKYQSPAFFEDILSRQLGNGNIRKLEVRIGPDSDERRMRKTLKDALTGYKNILLSDGSSGYLRGYYSNVNGQFPLFGITIHFIKKKSNIENACYYISTNDGDRGYDMNRECEENYFKEAEVISRLRSEIPNLDKYIVGIDAASRENNAEPYLFKEAYGRLRNLDFSRYDNAETSGYKKDIGFTFHVGEEFRDIISGLRHVDEVVQHLGFRHGDRLGHAIVLGIDMDKWADMNQVIYIPIEEYMENLLWEWGLYVSDRDYRDYENVNYIENQIMRLAERIFGVVSGIDVRGLYENYQRKLLRYEAEECPFFNKGDGNSDENKCFIQKMTHVKKTVKDNTFISNYSEESWNREKVYAAMNCKHFLDEVKKIVAININRDVIEKYKKLQRYMRRKISKKGIIIEINPTSNIMIGDFASYEDYHILNLSSPENEEVIITINTDDPVVFNTMLKDEFALIYDIVIKKGNYSEKQVVEWLDRIRKNGMDYSFIQDRGMDKQSIIDELDQIIRALE